MADEKKERKVLIVTSVGSKREPSAGNPVITFGAHDEGNEDTKGGYEAWSNALVDQVVAGARLDCEVTHVPKGDSIILRVTQMFDEKGNPIRPASRRSPGGGSYGKSDEQVRLERISIEGQSGYNGIIELLKAKIIELTHDQAKTALDYAEKKMRASMAPQPVAKEPTEEKKERKAEPKVEQKAQAPAPPKIATPPAVEKPPAEAPPPTEEKKISNTLYEQLKKVAKDKGYTNETITPMVKFYGVALATDLNQQQGQELLEKLQRGEGLPKQKEIL